MKYFKNPKRNEVTNIKSYMPQYKVLNKVPEQVNFSLPHNNQPVPHHAPVILKKDVNKPQNSFKQKNTPYADQSQFVMGNSIPNVGNNIENTWSSMDSVTIGDEEEEVNLSEPMIDNNYQETIDNVPLPPTTDVSLPETSEDDVYLLFINNELVAQGTSEEIESGVKELIFELNTNPDIITVFKKIQVKIGVFLLG